MERTPGGTDIWVCPACSVEYRGTGGAANICTRCGYDVATNMTRQDEADYAASMGGDDAPSVPLERREQIPPNDQPSNETGLEYTRGYERGWKDGYARGLIEEYERHRKPVPYPEPGSDEDKRLRQYAQDAGL